MKYITVCDLAPKAKYFVARQLIGADRYVVVAVCTSESAAVQICKALNSEEKLPNEVKRKDLQSRRAA
jgi:hypothetical protein